METQYLKTQLKKLEDDFEQVKSNLYRLDGAIQLVKALIAEAEKKEPPPST